MTHSLSVFWEYLGGHEPYSGLGTHMRELKNGLFSLGLSPVYLGDKSCVHGLLRKAPLSKVTCPYYSSLLLKTKFRTGDKSSKEILHSFANLNTDSFFRRGPGSRRVLTVHDVTPLLAKDKVSYLSYLQFKYFLGPALGSSDVVVCVSGWTKSCLEDLYPEFSHKFLVVPNGYVSPVVGGLLSDPGVPLEDELRVLCVSRFEPYKNFDICLDALSLLPTLKLSFVTDEPGFLFLSSEAKRRGVTNRLRLYSSVSRKKLLDLYAECHVFLSTSSFEGFCLPALDALSCSRPVVYQKGHALDDLLDPRCSVSVDGGSLAQQWGGGS